MIESIKYPFPESPIIPLEGPRPVQEFERIFRDYRLTNPKAELIEFWRSQDTARLCIIDGDEQVHSEICKLDP